MNQMLLLRPIFGTTLDLARAKFCSCCQMWFTMLQKFGLQVLAPDLDDEFFEDWWANASERVAGQVQKSLNSIIILGAWNLWNHRNRYVFNGASPSITSIIATTLEDLHLWSMAGARGVSCLLSLVPSDS